MEKQNKSTGKTVLIVLLLIVTIVSLVLATYAWAKYTTNTDGQVTAQVAKWNVTVDTENSKFSQTYTHVLPEMLAPGTAGQLDANVTIGADTEVDVAYSIYVQEVQVKFRDTAATGEAKLPTNMKFKNAAGQDITAQINALVNAGPKNRDGGVVIASSDRVEYKTGATIDAALTWEWPYVTGDVIDEVSNINAGDEADTKDGENPVEITFIYRVDAWQVQPEGPNA